MEQLSIVDHTEWWITYEDATHHGIYLKTYNEKDARRTLAARRLAAPSMRYEVQEVAVHRTAKKLDW